MRKPVAENKWLDQLCTVLITVTVVAVSSTLARGSAIPTDTNATTTGPLQPSTVSTAPIPSPGLDATVMSLGIPEAPSPSPGVKGDGGSIKPPIVVLGSWILHSEMPKNIKMHCYSQLTDLKTGDLVAGSTFSHSFNLDPHSSISEVWVCHFDWVIGGSGPHLENTFAVWAHDGRKPYLDKCINCEWLVKKDGFSYKEDGKWYWVYNWHQKVHKDSLIDNVN